MGTMRDKEPWLAGGLSWMLPGAGHLYVGSYVMGCLLLCSVVLLHVIFLGAIISRWVPPILLLPLAVCRDLLFPAFVCAVILCHTRKRNSRSFEAERNSARDPWLSVFLSLLLPGAGQAYARNYGSSILFILSFAAIYVASQTTTWGLVMYVILLVAACSHAYAVCQVYRPTGKRALLFLMLLVVVLKLGVEPTVAACDYGFVFDLTEPGLGWSMTPTLKQGDRVIVDKLTYRWHEPRAGDIIAFLIPGNNEQDGSLVGVKRIVAIAGDVVHIDGGSVLVSGRSSEFIRNEYTGPWSVPPGRAEYLCDEDGSMRNHAGDEPYAVPENHYFVVGDNLRESIDSRHFGPIPSHSIIGRVAKIVWPISRVRVIR